MPGAVFRTKLIIGVAADVLTLSRPGANIVGSGVARMYLPFNFTIVGVTAALGTPATVTALTADLNYNGTTILQAPKVTVPVGANVGTSVVPATTFLASGGYMTMDIDSAGAGAADFVLSVLGHWS